MRKRRFLSQLQVLRWLAANHAEEQISRAAARWVQMNRVVAFFLWLSCAGILRTKMGLALWLNPVIRCDLHRLPLSGTFRTLAADARMAGFDGLRQIYAVAIRRFAASELKLH